MHQILRRNMIQYIILPLFFLTVLGLLSCGIVYVHTQKNVVQSSQALLSQNASIVDLLETQINMQRLHYQTSPYLKMTIKRLLREEKQTYSSRQALNIINSYLASENANPYIISMYLYYRNDNGRFISSSNLSAYSSLYNYNDTEWYSLYQEQADPARVWTVRRRVSQYDIANSYKPCITVFLPLDSKGNSVAVINLNASALKEILSQNLTYQKQAFIIRNEADEIILSAGDAGTLQKAEKFPAGYVAQTQKALYFDWEYTLITPVRSFYSYTYMLIGTIIAFLILFISLEIPLLIRISRKNSGTLHTIMNILNAADSSSLLDSYSQNMDSYNLLIKKILTAFIENQYYKAQIKEKDYAMRILELTSLQAQINPHFIFNTLHTLNWKAIELTKGPNDVNRMIEDLSSILSYSLRNPTRIVSLDEEIENLRCYISILENRFGEKIHIKLEEKEIDDSFRIPKLLIQPLVENCIQHGYQTLKSEIMIDISLSQREETLYVSVQDYGQGIPAHVLKQLKEQIRAHESPDSGHMGLLNLNKRLWLLFKEKYQLNIRSSAAGTRVEIVVPLTPGGKS